MIGGGARHHTTSLESPGHRTCEYDGSPLDLGRAWAPMMSRCHTPPCAPARVNRNDCTGHPRVVERRVGRTLLLRSTAVADDAVDLLLCSSGRIERCIPLAEDGHLGIRDGQLTGGGEDGSDGHHRVEVVRLLGSRSWTRGRGEWRRGRGEWRRITRLWLPSRIRSWSRRSFVASLLVQARKGFECLDARGSLLLLLLPLLFFRKGYAFAGFLLLTTGTKWELPGGFLRRVARNAFCLCGPLGLPVGSRRTSH